MNISRGRTNYIISSNIVRAQIVPEIRLIIIYSKIVCAETVPDLKLFVMSINVVRA
jgi:hypothetical protein